MKKLCTTSFPLLHVLTFPERFPFPAVNVMMLALPSLARRMRRYERHQKAVAEAGDQPNADVIVGGAGGGTGGGLSPGGGMGGGGGGGASGIRRLSCFGAEVELRSAAGAAAEEEFDDDDDDWDDDDEDDWDDEFLGEIDEESGSDPAQRRKLLRKKSAARQQRGASQRLIDPMANLHRITGATVSVIASRGGSLGDILRPLGSFNVGRNSAESPRDPLGDRRRQSSHVAPQTLCLSSFLPLLGTTVASPSTTRTVPEEDPSEEVASPSGENRTEESSDGRTSQESRAEKQTGEESGIGETFSTPSPTDREGSEVNRKSEIIVPERDKNVGNQHYETLNETSTSETRPTPFPISDTIEEETRKSEAEVRSGTEHDGSRCKRPQSDATAPPPVTPPCHLPPLDGHPPPREMSHPSSPSTEFPTSHTSSALPSTHTNLTDVVVTNLSSTSDALTALDTNHDSDVLVPRAFSVDAFSFPLVDATPSPPSELLEVLEEGPEDDQRSSDGTRPPSHGAGPLSDDVRTPPAAAGPPSDDGHGVDGRSDSPPRSQREVIWEARARFFHTSDASPHGVLNSRSPLMLRRFVLDPENDPEPVEATGKCTW